MKLLNRSKRTGHKAVQLSQPKIATKTMQERSIEMIERAIKGNYMAVIIEYKPASGFITREIYGRKEFDKVLYDMKYHYDENLYSEHIDNFLIERVHAIPTFDDVTDSMIQVALGGV